jgi:Cu-Zn family superoxide dismutase
MTTKQYIANFSGKISGYVLFSQKDDREQTLVTIKLSGFQPKAMHAIHIHEFGDMREGCMSCGPHYNPLNRNHGSIYIDKLERHMGDLINNIKADENGNVNQSYRDNLVDLWNPDISILGRSVMIHENIDDYGVGPNEESKRTGNAGGRMTCAIIGLAKKIEKSQQ